MASAIKYHDQFFFVFNRRFYELVDFGLEVGRKTAKTEIERSYVTKLVERTPEFWPGYHFAVESELPSAEERKFWARVYFDVAYLIFRREIGSHDTCIWQTSAIGDAYLLARMITRSVQEEEMGWFPKTLATIEAENFHEKGLHVKL